MIVGQVVVSPGNCRRHFRARRFRYFGYAPHRDPWLANVALACSKADRDHEHAEPCRVALHAVVLDVAVEPVECALIERDVLPRVNNDAAGIDGTYDARLVNLVPPDVLALPRASHGAERSPATPRSSRSSIAAATRMAKSGGNRTSGWTMMRLGGPSRRSSTLHRCAMLRETALSALSRRNSVGASPSSAFKLGSTWSV